MKHFLKYFGKVCICIILTAPVFMSCADGPVFEKEKDCHSGARIRFIYDYNMEYANAFHNQVDCLNVYVYDEDGNYVTERNVVGDSLKDENYRMKIDLPKGKYNFVAYGGMECEKSSFTFSSSPGLHAHKETNENMLIDSEIGNELHPLFFGTYDSSLEIKELDGDYRDITVPMIKNTNTIRVLLQQIDGEPLDCNEFDFKITADNMKMRHDNKVVLGHNADFSPWAMGNESPGTQADGSTATVAWGELSIPRLVDATQIVGLGSGESYEGPILEVTHKAEGRRVVSLPLLKYLLLCKPVSSTKAEGMSDQEFLDRESRYQLFFFLDKHYQWVSVQIQVESWVVRINNINNIN